MDFRIIASNLTGLQSTLNTLDEEEFTMAIVALSNSTIGEHTRHIIELFQCLLNGYNEGRVNYDARKRNIEIQNNKFLALASLDTIILELNRENKNLILTHILSESPEYFETNYFRELLYNFEHCIHHQALIKVGLLELNKQPLSASFGVASSTLKFREECAQ